MRRIYPPTNWSGTVKSMDQFDHVCEEMNEVLLEAPEFTREKFDQEKLDGEMADLEHTIQTYWDCRKAEGADVDAIRAAAMDKNRARNYYPLCECGCGRETKHIEVVAGEVRRFCTQCQMEREKVSVMLREG